MRGEYEDMGEAMPMDRTLCRVAGALNGSGVLWGVGGSRLLREYGLIELPNDIDILVNLANAEAAAAVLGAMGEALPCGQNPTYATRFFRRYIVDGIGVDLMAGFAIRHADGQYDYVFDGASVPVRREVEGIQVPFAALEDWFVAYQLIPGKEAKADRIGEYLSQRGVARPRLLERALQGCLPDAARERILALYGKQSF